MANKKRKWPDRVPAPVEVSPSGDREPLQALTREELLDVYKRIGAALFAPPNQFDADLHWRMMKLVMWVLPRASDGLTIGEILSNPRGLVSSDTVRLVRWQAFSEGINVRGWDEAGEFAEEKLRGTIAAGAPETMRDAYQEMQKRLPLEQRRSRKTRRIRLPD
jgi:hypothetical protein